jgi:hypothetical protein
MSKRFDHAGVRISGIELAEKIQKGQVQDGEARRVQCDDDGTVERGSLLEPVTVHQLT